MFQHLLGPVALYTQATFVQRPANGYGNMADVIYFNAVKSTLSNEFRPNFSFDGIGDEDERNLLSQLTQDVQNWRRLPVGAGILGDNDVIGLCTQPCRKLFVGN